MKKLITFTLLGLSLISFNSCKLGGENGNENGEGCGRETGELNHQTCTTNNKTTGFIAPADSVVLGGLTYHECKDASFNPALCRNGVVFHQFSPIATILKTFKLNPGVNKICFLVDTVQYTATSTGTVTAQACL